MRIKKIDIYDVFNWIILGLIGLLAGIILGYAISPPKATTSAPHKTVQHVWTKADSLAYAHDQMEVFAGKQYACLSNLWGKESAWDPKAHNKVRVQGKTAGGIPQLLGMSPLVLPVIQIDRGLSYIYYRWTTPCKAWEHWKHYYWY